MRPPRALIVPFELGRPLGAPGLKAFQRRVVGAALALAQRIDVPVAAEWDLLPPDGSTDGESNLTDQSGAATDSWACPVSFPTSSSGEGIVDAVRREIVLLRPWHDRAIAARGTSRVGVSGLTIEGAVDALSAMLEAAEGGHPLPDTDAQSFKLAAEDLKLFYLEAATAQPGASSRALADWFWRDTTAARLLRRLSRALSGATVMALRIYAIATLVPEAYREGDG